MNAVATGRARAAARAPARPGLRALLREWVRRWRQRRRLEDLDDRMLRDVGVTRADAEREARRPFWQA